MFEREYRSLSLELLRNGGIFEKIITEVFPNEKYDSAESLIHNFTQSHDPEYQSSVLRELLIASVDKSYQQYCFLLLTALFWRNLTYLACSCEGRNLAPRDLLSQANLILLELGVKASKRAPSEKIYVNLSRSLRRDFYAWVSANDFEYIDIGEHQVPEPHQTSDATQAIKQILATNILKKKELELWLEVARDERSLKEIAEEKGVNYDAFQKRLRRINQKIEKNKK